MKKDAKNEWYLEEDLESLYRAAMLSDNLPQEMTFEEYKKIASNNS